ncbi:alpha-ketoglutarate-dependent dioxygenase AlkB [Lewinella sp. LCG006]|uniref:alpha-ketoglutarate-dependent dioxygenase AlkB n=1 Tax=Lewinella sp. LCG006 TaxID=3231911 RepID=UPI00345F8F1A
MNHELFEPILLDKKAKVYVSNTVPQFNLSYEAFLQLWERHPPSYHRLMMHGKEVLTPRWQQAYGKNYRYTGSQNNALAIDQDLKKYLEWACEHIDSRLNGLLLNWYDGQQNHYIGAHRDDTRDLMTGSPIVTISFGQERIFRMRPHGMKGFKDFTVRNGEAIIIPWETNLSWTHEVPAFKKYNGKRISITMRAFK